MIHKSIIISLFFSSALFSQSRQSAGITVNGNHTIDSSFYISKCGLGFTSASIQLCQRSTLNGLVQPAVINITGIPPNTVIEKAFLYTDASGNGIPVTALLTNPAGGMQNFPMTIIGQDIDKGWGYTGTFSYRAEVTSIISGNGTYLLSGLPTALSDSLNDVDGATLFIIYSDSTVTTWKGNMLLLDGAWVEQHTFNIGVFYNEPFFPCTPQGAEQFTLFSDIDRYPSVSLFFEALPFFSVNGQIWNFIQRPIAFPAGPLHINFNLSTGYNEWANVVMEGIYLQTLCGSDCYNYLDIPNIFTPNADGINDVFKISQVNLAEMNCNIYNRWGVRVYSINSPGAGWDGLNTAGEPCSEGVYYYTFTGKFRNSEVRKKSGFIQVLR